MVATSPKELLEHYWNFLFCSLAENLERHDEPEIEDILEILVTARVHVARELDHSFSEGLKSANLGEGVGFCDEDLHVESLSMSVEIAQTVQFLHHLRKKVASSESEAASQERSAMAIA